MLRSPQGVGGLDEHFGRAQRMLGSNPYRTGQGFAKASVFDAIAERAGMKGEPVPINVNRSQRVTRYGTQRGACTNCGDCCIVCNVGAKNTLASNYLPMARHFGVQLFTRVEVDACRRHARRIPGDSGRRAQRAKTTRPHQDRRSLLAAAARGDPISCGGDAVLSCPAFGGARGTATRRRAYNTDRARMPGLRTGRRARADQATGIKSNAIRRRQPDPLYKRFTVQDRRHRSVVTPFVSATRPSPS